MLLQSSSRDSSGLYLHVPFCAQSCDFCAFYKERADRSKIDAYLTAIEAELCAFPPTVPVSTVFLGGGTPTLLAAQDLDRLCGAVKEAVDKSRVLGAPASVPRAATSGIPGFKGHKALNGEFAEAEPLGKNSQGVPPLEWTVECAPATLRQDKLAVLKKHGANRFSLGVQSFNPVTLEAIGRPHLPKQAQEAIALLKGETDNWNLDLIFAAADSTLAGWQRDLETAIALDPHHLSTYCLTFESDTALFAKMLRDSKKRPTPDEEARFYLATWETLRSAGFHHYELANFARPGCECCHNLSTWRMGQWFGYGPSAASQVAEWNRSFRRTTNISDLTAWASGVHSGQRALTDVETLTPAQMALDALIFGLRLVDGVDIAELQARFAPFDAPKLAALKLQLETHKLLEGSGAAMWRLTDAGLLVADRIALEIMKRFDA